MRGVNQHTVLGTLGRDPEMRTTPSGAQVANFSLAVNEVWTDKGSGEKKESTEWINCVIWNRGAEVIVEYCRKGQPLYVQGRSRTRKWEDKDGKDRYTTELHVDTFQLVASGGSGGQRQADAGREEQHNSSAPTGKGGQPDNDFDQSIPF